MDMKEMTLTDFCALTASNEPAPGGGSVSALAGALSAALAEMVARLTLGKKGYEEAAPQMENIAREAEALRGQLLDDITRDSKAFDAYMEAMTLPKGTDEEKQLRRDAMQTALKKAAETPLSVAETAAKIMPMAAAVVTQGNRNAVTDGLVAAMLARTAVLGALLNVRINLGSIKDEAYVAQMGERVRSLEVHIRQAEADVIASSSLADNP